MEADIRIKKRLGQFLLDVQFSSDIKRLGLLGASGCGKSLTLRCIAGIEKPDEGYIRIGDRVLFDSAKGIDLKPGERRVGYLFQSYALFPNMTVAQNIAAGLKAGRTEKEEKVREFVKAFRLEGLEEQLPGQLSGGQKQRVALARMLAVSPEVILLDEPFSALDVYLKDTLIQEMDERLSKYGVPVILVSHSRDEIYRLCNKTAVMDEGNIRVCGETEAVFREPIYAKAASLTGCKNIIRARRLDEHSISLPLWDVTLKMPGKVPEDLGYAGIRAHELIPVYDEKDAGEDCIRVGDYHTAELQFERQYYISPAGASVTEEERLRYFVQRNRAAQIDELGMPPFLRIPAGQVMLLR